MHTTRLGVTMVLAAAAACASAGSGSDRQFRSRDVLSREQIAEVRATNAYEAVERLRSHWLVTRGRSRPPSAGGTPQFEENRVLVYMDDQRLGTVEQLRRIEIGVIDHIRYYSPAEASARWGFNHGGGVIWVSSRPATR